MKKQTFMVNVKAGYRFPLDMLRYDTCYPKTGDDVRQIEISQDLTFNELDITIERWVENKYKLPTIERWKSFGCGIYNVETH